MMHKTPRQRSHRFLNFLAMLLLLLTGYSAQAEEKQILTIESTISGSQEQPNILVIVPWQQPGDAPALQNTDDPEASNVFLQPVERKAFLRKTQWLNRLLAEENP